MLNDLVSASDDHLNNVCALALPEPVVYFGNELTREKTLVQQKRLTVKRYLREVDEFLTKLTSTNPRPFPRGSLFSTKEPIHERKLVKTSFRRHVHQNMFM